MPEYRYVVIKEQDYSAAHYLRECHGMCERLHGHNYRCRIHVGANELDTEGMVVDFADIKEALQKVIKRFDHQLLNEVKPFDEVNPTLEHVAQHIAEEVARVIDSERRRVFACELWETERNVAIYYR
jgi:6-pyruvoyltetrahydropterin/6-carboxytetrahydropterin synthase